MDAVGSGRDSLRPSPLPLSLSYGIGQDDDEAARDAVARSLAVRMITQICVPAEDTDSSASRSTIHSWMNRSSCR